MNRDKQIEEIYRILLDGCNGIECNECEGHDKKDGCLHYHNANTIYNAGFRNAISVVRDIFNDLNEMWHKGRGFINYSDLVRLERLHEQKYAGSEKEDG